MKRRDMMLALAAGKATGGYVPAAFFLHFDPAYHRGRAAVDRHVEYFRATGMDMLKIQYEHPFPKLPAVKRPEDWRSIEPPGRDHFEEPLSVVDGIVKAAGREAPVIVTLYSPLMHAQHATSRDLLTAHLGEDPEAVGAGLLRIAGSVLTFARECIARGVDGFYMSTQGGEAGRFASPGVFARGVAPADLLVMRELAASRPFTILHVCDYNGDYDDLTPYAAFPGHIVNCGTRLRRGAVTPREAAALFGRPFMGGMDRHGVISTGTAAAIRAEVKAILAAAPELFVLGADCTVASETPWTNLKTAIDAAHEGR